MLHIELTQKWILKPYSNIIKYIVKLIYPESNKIMIIIKIYYVYLWCIMYILCVPTPVSTYIILYPSKIFMNYNLTCKLLLKIINKITPLT